jgi:hypothetical protein
MRKLRIRWEAKCQDCGHTVSFRRSSWRVSDVLWSAAGYKPTDIACKRCLFKSLRTRFQLKQRNYYEVFHAVMLQLRKEKAA